MGNRGRKFGGRRRNGDDDLERLRENVLDHPDLEDEVAGNDSTNDNSSSAETGPVKVIVKQDGIGRTGGIVLGVVAGLALGLAVMTLITMLLRDESHRDAENRRHAETMEQLRKTETEARMVQYYLQDPSFRTKAELEEWARYKGKEK